VSRPPFDPAEMALRGRIGAYRLHATHDPRETTAPARSAFLARFEREVDPDGSLSPQERQRRALAARKAYFARLALKSAKKRARRREAPDAA
jgi:hypothetical protein